MSFIFISRETGKLGIAELCRVVSQSSAEKEMFKKKFSLKSNFMQKNNFCFRGFVDDQPCIFKIDTGSDVSVLNKRFVKENKQRVFVKHCNLRYPTGEEVPIDFKLNAKIVLGKYCLEFPVFVSEIGDDCILGADFLVRTGHGEIFASAFGKVHSEFENFSCARINNLEVPSFLLDCFEKNSFELNFSEKKQFAEFLKEFQDVFSEEVIAGNCAVEEHSINLEEGNPIKQAPRRIPFQLRHEVEKILEEMKLQGVIEESHSPWVSPAVLVKKKDGSLRFCVDFRKLNAITKKDSYPMPRIDDLFDNLSGNSWFSTLDLKSGYWQVKLRSQDREKTAFSIGNGLWQFTVMPFGLCNAPATFERLMEKVLHQIINKICLVYLDDVIIFGKTFEDSLANLREVFLRLREANLKLNPKKCSFFGRKVKYLGHIC
jgi:hypothetical protein